MLSRRRLQLVVIGVVGVLLGEVERAMLGEIEGAMLGEVERAMLGEIEGAMLGDSQSPKLLSFLGTCKRRLTVVPKL